MNRNPYDVLGIPSNATDDAVKDAYRAKARQFGSDAAAMQEINDAYDEIVRLRTSQGGFDASPFSGVRALFARGDFTEAERELDLCPTGSRNAEWHFLKSVCLDRRGRTGDAMQELNVACSMDPGNEEYAQSREVYRQRAGGYGDTYRGNAYAGQRRSGVDTFCNCCTNLVIADCCCECMGGDLCRCI